MAIEKRYYYKHVNGHGYLNLKSPYKGDNAQDYVEITKEEFDELTKPLGLEVEVHEPTEQEIAQANAKKEIAACKRELATTDYIALKLAECTTTTQRTALHEEYADQLNRRAELRARINELESTLE